MAATKDAQIATLKRQLQEKDDAGLKFLDQLSRDAGALAREHDWCSIYSNFMEEHGLPDHADPETYTVTVTGTFTVTLEDVELDDPDSPEDNINDYDVRASLNDATTYGMGTMAITSWQITGTEPS